MNIQLSKETRLVLDALAAIGNVVEIVDLDGVYVYCSENSNFADIEPKDMIGKNVKDIYRLTDDTSKVMRVLHTGVPIRDYLMSFLSVATGKRYLWLYSAYPLIVDGKLIGAITVYKPFSNVKSLVDEYDGTEEHKSDCPASVQTTNLFTFDDIIYTSANMEETIKLCRKVAKSNSSILLVGETGTGKQMFAESIHSESSKNSKPFISVNCAAIPDTLLESILFGVTKGAYTGAVEKAGLFEQSSDGTIFLDEIQALSPEMQAKLLRVLEYKVVRRVGSDREIKVNPRIVTAMNVNPLDYMKAGKLKPDLFYRIAVVTIRIPPLRERTSDIPVLVNYFIQKANSNFSRSIERCSDQVMQHFFEYEWPGNVRELQHTIEHAIAVMDECNTCIQMDDLPSLLMRNAPMAVETKELTGLEIENVFGQIEKGGLSIDYKSAHNYALNEFNRQFNRFFIKHALEVENYNISQTAQKIKITRQFLHRLIRRYDIR